MSANKHEHSIQVTGWTSGIAIMIVKKGCKQEVDVALIPLTCKKLSTPLSMRHRVLFCSPCNNYYIDTGSKVTLDTPTVSVAGMAIPSIPHPPGPVTYGSCVVKARNTVL